MKLETPHDYRITGAWLRRFQRDYERLECKPLGNVSPVIRKAQLEAIVSQVEDLRQQVKEFESLKI